MMLHAVPYCVGAVHGAHEIEDVRPRERPYIIIGLIPRDLSQYVDRLYGGEDRLNTQSPARLSPFDGMPRLMERAVVVPFLARGIPIGARIAIAPTRYPSIRTPPTDRL